MPRLPEGKEAKAWLKDRDKYVTGFCNDIGKPAQCEGTRPRSPSGKPMKVCEFHLTCPCKCHYDIDQMYKLAGMERIEPVVNPEYVPEGEQFVMPDPVVRFTEPPSFIGGGPDGPPIAEGIVAPTPAPSMTPSLPPTPTGRRHRGELEYQVLEAVNAWGGDNGLCTPKIVAEWIAAKYTIPLPSTGAIQAVWNRWEKLGIAVQAKKPVRFVGWTGDFNGSAETLERLKASKKRQEKSAKSAAARGFR